MKIYFIKWRYIFYQTKIYFYNMKIIFIERKYIFIERKYIFIQCKYNYFYRIKIILSNFATFRQLCSSGPLFLVLLLYCISHHCDGKHIKNRSIHGFFPPFPDQMLIFLKFFESC